MPLRLRLARGRTGRFSVPPVIPASNLRAVPAVPRHRPTGPFIPGILHTAGGGRTRLRCVSRYMTPRYPVRTQS